MQTFLPFSDFAASAAVLDRARLGKQRIEVLQLLRVLCGETTGWANHPAARMWRGHRGALARYGLAACAEWVRRGYVDTTAEKIAALVDLHDLGAEARAPAWIDDETVLLAYRSNLVRKAPDFYGRLWPDVSAGLPYVWPAP